MNIKVKDVMAAKQFYDTVKFARPLNTKFIGDESKLRDAITTATDESTFLHLQRMGVANPHDIDGLLDYLYGARAFGGDGVLTSQTLNKLIPAIEKYCDSK